MPRGQVRANWLKLVIGTAKRRPPPERERVLAAFTGEFRREVREASTLGWIDVDRFAQLHHAIREALGDDRARAFWRQVMLDGLQRPLLGPLRSGATGMFGEHPGALLRFTPHAWSLVTRHCAKVSFDERVPDDPGFTGGCLLRFSPLDPAVTPEVFEPLFVGGATAALELLGFDGESRRRPGTPGPTVEVEVDWRPRASATAESGDDRRVSQASS